MKTEREASVGSDVDAELVDVTSADSFPASDAPAWATGRAHPHAAGEADDQTETQPPAPDDPKTETPVG